MQYANLSRLPFDTAITGGIGYAGASDRPFYNNLHFFDTMDILSEHTAVGVVRSSTCIAQQHVQLIVHLPS